MNTQVPTAPTQGILPILQNNFKVEQEKKDDAIGNANDNVVVQEVITNTKDKGFEYYHFTCSDMMSLNADETQKDKNV